MRNWSKIIAGNPIRFRRVTINGLPGIITETESGEIINTINLEVDGGVIRRINSVVNPDKLSHLGPVTDPYALLREWKK
jgi:RNA polymerase sigma-70 factor (ECF subfamily)